MLHVLLRPIDGGAHKFKLNNLKWNKGSTESLVSFSSRWKEGAWDWNAGAVWSLAHPVILTLWHGAEVRAFFPSVHRPPGCVRSRRSDSQLSSHTPSHPPFLPPLPTSLPCCCSETVPASLWRLGLDCQGLGTVRTGCSLASYKPDITCSERHP